VADGAELQRGHLGKTGHSLCQRHAFDKNRHLLCG
jgi:hypothetical protein